MGFRAMRARPWSHKTDDVGPSSPPRVTEARTRYVFALFERAGGVGVSWKASPAKSAPCCVDAPVGGARTRVGSDVADVAPALDGSLFNRSNSASPRMARAWRSHSAHDSSTDCSSCHGRNRGPSLV